MSQNASSSSQTISSQLNIAGARKYPIPTGFATESVQSAVGVIKQYSKVQIAKAEAILDIQSSLTSREAEPSNKELISALSTYISILDDINQQSAHQNHPRGASATQAPI